MLQSFLASKLPAFPMPPSPQQQQQQQQPSPMPGGGGCLSCSCCGHSLGKAAAMVDDTYHVYSKPAYLLANVDLTGCQRSSREKRAMRSGTYDIEWVTCECGVPLGFVYVQVYDDSYSYKLGKAVMLQEKLLCRPPPPPSQPQPSGSGVVPPFTPSTGSFDPSSSGSGSSSPAAKSAVAGGVVNTATLTIPSTTTLTSAGTSSTSSCSASSSSAAAASDLSSVALANAGIAFSNEKSTASATATATTTNPFEEAEDEGYVIVSAELAEDGVIAVD